MFLELVDDCGLDPLLHNGLQNVGFLILSVLLGLLAEIL